LFLKVLMIMIVRQLPTGHELLSVLAQPTVEMQTWHTHLADMDGRFPSRRTWERRLATVADVWPSKIGCLGRALAALLQPWLTCARAAVIDSTVLRVRGGVWHKKDREAGRVAHTSIDTEAVWAKADTEHAPALIRELPADLRFLLSHQHYYSAKRETVCEQQHYTLVTTRNTQRRPHPCTDPGVEVRRILPKTRSLDIEDFNEQFKGSLTATAMPHQGTPHHALSCLVRGIRISFIWLYRHQIGTDLRVGLKAFLMAA
jgi:hypothetical protein